MIWSKKLHRHTTIGTVAWVKLIIKRGWSIQPLSTLATLIIRLLRARFYHFFQCVGRSRICIWGWTARPKCPVVSVSLSIIRVKRPRWPSTAWTSLSMMDPRYVLTGTMDLVIRDSLAVARRVDREGRTKEEETTTIITTKTLEVKIIMIEGNIIQKRGK